MDGFASAPQVPAGQRIGRFFAAHLLRPGAGEIVRQTGEPLFCGSLACRLLGYEEVPRNLPLDKGKRGRRFSGEILSLSHDGRQSIAGHGYLPTLLDRAMKRLIDRGKSAEFAGDVWCEPASGARLGYRFTVYDRRSR